MDLLAHCPIHGRLSPESMRAFSWEEGEGCPLIMGDECDCGEPLTFSPDPMQGAVAALTQITTGEWRTVAGTQQVALDALRAMGLDPSTYSGGGSGGPGGGDE